MYPLDNELERTVSGHQNYIRKQEIFRTFIYGTGGGGRFGKGTGSIFRSAGQQDTRRAGKEISGGEEGIREENDGMGAGGTQCHEG